MIKGNLRLKVQKMQRFNLQEQTYLNSLIQQHSLRRPISLNLIMAVEYQTPLPLRVQKMQVLTQPRDKECPYPLKPQLIIMPNIIKSSIVSSQEIVSWLLHLEVRPQIKMSQGHSSNLGKVSIQVCPCFNNLRRKV